MTIAEDGNVGIGTTTPGKHNNVFTHQYQEVNGIDDTNYKILDMTPDATNKSSLIVLGTFNSSYNGSTANFSHSNATHLLNMKRYSGIDFKANWGTYTKVSAYLRFTPMGNYFRGALDFGVGDAQDATTQPTLAMRIAADGKIGMGVEVPSEKLHVNGNIKLTNSSYSVTLSTEHNNFLKIASKCELGELANGGFYIRDPTYIYSNPWRLYYNTSDTWLNADSNINLGIAGSAKLSINSSGNVGIGTTPNSSYKLDVSGNIRGSSVYTTNYYYSSSHMYIQAGYGYNMYFQTNGVIRQTINTSGYVGFSGRVGIGTTNPSFPLDINTTTAGPGFYAARFEYDGDTHGEAYTAGDQISLRCQGQIWCKFYVWVSSDSRIKTNIVDVPDNLALEQLRSIPCRYYEYIDKVERGSDKTIGFIAQEVKSVFPMAVTQQKEIIPNIFKVINSTWTNVDNTFIMSSTDLPNVSGIKYRFYISNNSNYTDVKITEIIGNSDNTFTFDAQYANVFCYGSEVDDFHILDKQKLFTLNFSATQELDKQQTLHNQSINNLQSEVSSLKTEVNTLKNENAELKSIIDKLKTATSFEDFKSQL